MPRASPISSFSQPRLSQNASPLLALPAELRLKILRNLLKEESLPVAYYLEDSSRESVERALSLSAQVLRCCQTLYLEGLDILYNENILCINVDKNRFHDEADRGAETVFSALDVYFTVKDSQPLRGGHFTIDRLKRFGDLRSSRDYDLWGCSGVIKKRIERRLRRFRKIKITMTNNRNNTIWVCYMLRPLLFRKRFTIDLRWITFPNSTIPDTMFRQLNAMSLQPTVICPDGNKVYLNHPTLITSHSDGVEGAIDTCALWLHFESKVLSKIPGLKGVCSDEIAEIKRLGRAFERPERVHDLFTMLFDKAGKMIDEAPGRRPCDKKKLRTWLVNALRRFEVQKKKLAEAYEAEKALSEKSEGDP